ncbi:Pyrokinin-1 receptor [Chionoecetes opilio]|uniref:Pyrokinin-1 receptor n=1 Tax=Chionoecetes opilio TaxID=41210 RepID=A0A8J5D1X7_CHIOP|nr:Pyrokinin-1 receptor [Chionoecetes opilio]
MTSGFSFTRDTKPCTEPIIEEHHQFQIPTHRFHDKLQDSRYRIMEEATMGALNNTTPSGMLALTPTSSLTTFLIPTATSDYNNNNNSSNLVLGMNNSYELMEEADEDDHELVHGMAMTVVMTVIYILITVTGVLGNVATCVVIVRNRIMHTATNYYLFSLAISDLLLLAFGMPDEIYMLWRGRPYIFGASFCFIRGFTAEISTNASILTIAAFTVERYIGICHPLHSQTMSQLGRVVRSIAVIWVVATACAVPIAIQYGIVYVDILPSGDVDPDSSACTIKNRIKLIFEISTVLFFVAPLLLITVLYLCIAVQLKRSSHLARAGPSITSPNSTCTNDGSRNKAVVKMLAVHPFLSCRPSHLPARRVVLFSEPLKSLVFSGGSRAKGEGSKALSVSDHLGFIYQGHCCPGALSARLLLGMAVVIAFFLCFAPHQTQRLVALHGDASNPAVVNLFNILHNISGISYYISTCVNPILYHIMSNRFRKALKEQRNTCPSPQQPYYENILEKFLLFNKKQAKQKETKVALLSMWNKRKSSNKQQ